LDLAFGHCGKASKKTGTDLLAAFQLTHDLLFGILVIHLAKWQFSFQRLGRIG